MIISNNTKIQNIDKIILNDDILYLNDDNYILIYTKFKSSYYTCLLTLKYNDNTYKDNINLLYINRYVFKNTLTNIENFIHVYINSNSVVNTAPCYIDCRKLDITLCTSLLHMFYPYTFVNSSTDKTDLYLYIWAPLNTLHILNMSYMFSTCKYIYNLYNILTDNATDLSFMFFCYGGTELNISHFNTSNVSNISGIFACCNLVQNLDLINFNTSNVTDMSYMFYNCSSLTELDLINFNTSNVTDMSYMFYGCSNLINDTFTNLNTINVTNLSGILGYCNNQFIYSILPKIFTNSATSISAMFEGCNSLTELNISHFNTSNVTNMSMLFYNCESLRTIDLSNFDTSNVSDMRKMFYGCSSLTELDLSNFDISNIYHISSMFDGCSSLTKLDLSNFIFKSYYSTLFFSNMFRNCINLTNINLNWPTFVTIHYTDYMFYNCNSLTVLDLTKCNFNNLYNINNMFYGCSSLHTIYFKNFNLCGYYMSASFNGLFTKCTSLKNIIVTDSLIIGSNKNIYKKTLDLSDCPLSNESAALIINSISPQNYPENLTIIFSQYTFDTLTEEQIAIGTNKGSKIVRA